MSLSALSKEPDEAKDIRDAVRQLSFAYQRSSAMLKAVEPTLGDAEQIDADPESSAAPQPEALRRAEAVLYAAGEALSAEQVAASLPPGADAANVLMELKRVYAGRGVQLIEVAGKWRFQTAQDLSFLFVEERHEQRKLSQAASETLAIIAYGQPVTRAEIEAVRGVAVSKGTLDQLIEAGWVKLKGRRKTPGRPVTYGTSAAFLEHFGLESLDVLPGKAELAAEGLLSDVMPDDFLAEPLGEASEELDEIPDADIEAAFITDFLDRAGDDEG